MAIHFVNGWSCMNHQVTPPDDCHGSIHWDDGGRATIPRCERLEAAAAGQVAVAAEGHADDEGVGRDFAGALHTTCG
jgi:hypothetical protein